MVNFDDVKIPVGGGGTGVVGPAKTRDKWDRVTGFGCSTCMYFVPKKNESGRCRRHAPTLQGYPVVHDDDWCGDHKKGSNPLRPKGGK